MRLLVTGANGLLGSTLVRQATAAGHATIAAYHSTRPGIGTEQVQLDITDEKAVERIVGQSDVDAVVNCAAMTDVDGCETATDEAEAVNAVAPERLAEHASEQNAQFVHVSTDYVFDGEADTPYTPDAEPAPVQVYGRTKLAGERTVLNTHPEAFVPRLSFVYGRHGATDELTGFPAWVRDQLQAGESVPLFTDQWVTPTRAGQAATTILDALDAKLSGRAHVAARSCVTPFEFGERLAQELDADASLLAQGSTEDIDRTAERPSYTCLDVSKIETALDRAQPTFREDLKALF